jgi:uncharacterized protein YaaQ
MKMIFAIIKDDDVENVSQALTVSAYRFTRVATTGGLFKKGNTTLLSGVEDTQVESFINVLKENTAADANGRKGVTVFVMPVNHFEQI